ncbi:MAG: hypothetical protein GKS00_01490 [Alphaproteobacteria bacterium]|nr:hypothetical protein [Alphaproteobacteria bacterium]
MVIEGKFANVFLDPKKALNRGIGAFALIFCSPLLLGVAIGVKLGVGGAVFIAEPRQRDDDAAYVSWRFRTIHGDEQPAFGRFLHTSRLECLPQLVNVMRGDISIVAVLN